MAVRGQKTKLTVTKPKRSIIKGNENIPIGGSKNDGKQIKSNRVVPIGGLLHAPNKKIKSNWTIPIGGSKKIGTVRGPKITIRRTK